MSYPYIIMHDLDEGEDFEIDLSVFSAQLHAQWSKVVIHSKGYRKPHTLLVWDMHMGDYPLTGRIRGNFSISLDADLAHAAEFASWYRTLISPKYRLLFLDASGERDPIEVLVGMTGERIVEAYHSALP